MPLGLGLALPLRPGRPAGGGVPPPPDTTPPTGTVSINSGAPSTDTVAVTLTLSATDDYGVTEMRVANGADPSGATWQGYATTLPWTLTAGDGTKTVSVQYRDAANNVSTTATDTITLTTPDTTPPTGTVSINGGAASTDTTAVTLTLSASDNVGVTDMRIANGADPSGASWQPYATSLPWTLTAGDGTKTVSVQYRDAANNISTAATDTIDYAAPVAPIPTTGLVGWWDAADETSFSYGTGQAVAEWRDKSTKALHVGQSTAAARPVRSGTQNGKPTVVFSDTQFLSYNNEGSLLGGTLICTEAITVVQVLKVNAASSTGFTGAPLFITLVNLPRPLEYQNAMHYPINVATTAMATATTWSVWTLSATRALNGSEWRDGTALVAGTTNLNYAAIGEQKVHLGRRADGSVRFPGEAAEIIVYDRVLDTAERQQVESYLRAKWATP